MVTISVHTDDTCFCRWSIGYSDLTVTRNIEEHQNPTRAMLVGVVRLQVLE